jgi:hypothetical protein
MAHLAKQFEGVLDRYFETLLLSLLYESLTYEFNPHCRYTPLAEGEPGARERTTTGDATRNG